MEKCPKTPPIHGSTTGDISNVERYHKTFIVGGTWGDGDAGTPCIYVRLNVPSRRNIFRNFYCEITHQSRTSICISENIIDTVNIHTDRILEQQLPSNQMYFICKHVLTIFKQPKTLKSDKIGGHFEFKNKGLKYELKNWQPFLTCLVMF